MSEIPTGARNQEGGTPREWEEEEQDEEEDVARPLAAGSSAPIIPGLDRVSIVIFEYYCCGKGVNLSILSCHLGHHIIGKCMATACLYGHWWSAHLNKAHVLVREGSIDR